MKSFTLFILLLSVVAAADDGTPKCSGIKKRNNRGLVQRVQAAFLSKNEHLPKEDINQMTHFLIALQKLIWSFESQGAYSGAAKFTAKAGALTVLLATLSKPIASPAVKILKPIAMKSNPWLKVPSTLLGGALRNIPSDYTLKRAAVACVGIACYYNARQVEEAELRDKVYVVFDKLISLTIEWATNYDEEKALFEKFPVYVEVLKVLLDTSHRTGSRFAEVMHLKKMDENLEEIAEVLEDDIMDNYNHDKDRSPFVEIFKTTIGCTGIISLESGYE